jgi:ABC-type Fe3+ transport system permease subunit
LLVRALRSSVTARIARLRQPNTAARLARVLWIAWAVIVWNVVFDQVIVRAGRDYLVAVGRASTTHAVRPNMDAYMRPAAARGVWIASAAGALILVTGLASVRAAARRRAHDGRQVTSCA